jgi:Na+-driven multidrug efflux pump
MERWGQEFLKQALSYSNIVFGGSVSLWFLGSLTGIVRGMGDMKSAPRIAVFRAVAALPLFLILIFGWGPILRFGIVGAAIAMLTYYTFGIIGMVVHLQSARSPVHFTSRFPAFGCNGGFFTASSRWHRFSRDRFSSPASR